MNAEAQLHQYKVTVGHAEVTVTGKDEAEAVVAARKKFGIDMPRLWDKIYNLQETDFRVERIS